MYIVFFASLTLAATIGLGYTRLFRPIAERLNLNRVCYRHTNINNPILEQ
jgi:hypothetical protein